MADTPLPGMSAKGVSFIGADAQSGPGREGAACLFAHQSPDEHSGLVTGAYLRSAARRLGLNMTLFSRDVAEPALAAAVRADKQFGEALGVPGTPAFLINDLPFFGAQPLPAFEAAIAQARRGA